MKNTRRALIDFLRSSKYGVVSTIDTHGGPQAAVVGAAVTDALEIVFDTLASTRKCEALRRDPRVAFTMWFEEATVQVQGIADEPAGDELARLKRAYFAVFPDGPTRESWEGIAYVRIRPEWLRYTSFAGAAPEIIELDATALSSLPPL